MPKLKSHRGAMKRFKVTKKGKIKRFKAFASHLKLNKKIIIQLIKRKNNGQSKKRDYPYKKKEKDS